MFQNLIYVFHVVVCLIIIGLVLVQQGKGANIGASFGQGASGTVFGAAGKANFLARMTKWMVVLFFITSLVMMFNSGKITASKSVIDSLPVQQVPMIGGQTSTTSQPQ
ncbi:preprotein translocase subunit SecG [Ignatzschineria larvae DSM 13226]|uniref:Protein-export membrane protein SecG n=1 Tax=Ignatzschineria larvae DSM 13226 TaxID=1111732 RepID=A0ABZ3C2K7_9GAMM|nr:preprotein translocase subunit SecG [Ignatzschineria larvae]